MFISIKLTGCVRLCKSRGLSAARKAVLYRGCTVTNVRFQSRKSYIKDGMTEKFCDDFELYGHFRPSALTLQQLTTFGSKTGTELSSFEFLKKELPVRLANIMQEINDVPEQFQQMPSVAMVRNWYRQSFTEILEFENVDPENPEILANFAEVLLKIRNRHSNVVETMAQGVMELKDAYGMSKTESQIQYFLDRFYISRISIRMLINQHVLLYGIGLENVHPAHIGCIDPRCDVLEVVKDAYANAKFLCEQYYLTAPNYHIECYNPHEKTDTIQLVYVPSHLYHMLFELFKNAMRAVVESHQDSAEIPPLLVRICKGKEDLSIKLSDMGGGIPYEKTDLLFQYMYTTAPQPQPSHCREGSAPLAGYGYGLPLSRLYARYFKGDLMLSPMEGYGTDAIIYLKVLSDEANECLPVYNKTASRVYESDVPVSDWSGPSPWTQNPNRSFSTSARSYSTASQKTGLQQRHFSTWRPASGTLPI